MMFVVASALLSASHGHVCWWRYSICCLGASQTQTIPLSWSASHKAYSTGWQPYGVTAIAILTEWRNKENHAGRDTLQEHMCATACLAQCILSYETACSHLSAFPPLFLHTVFFTTQPAELYCYDRSFDLAALVVAGVDVGLEVFTAVVMKGIIFGDVTPYSLLSCNSTEYTSSHPRRWHSSGVDVLAGELHGERWLFSSGFCLLSCLALPFGLSSLRLLPRFKTHILLILKPLKLGRVPHLIASKIRCPKIILYD
jgi:hypothetical protein